MRVVAAAAMLVSLLVACSSELQPGDPETGNGGSGSGGGGGDDEFGSGMMNPGGPEDIGATCKKIDLVIAIDNSGSMSEEISAMGTTIFPLLAEALLTVGGGLEDFRVGVLDACPDPANYHTRGTGGDCGLPAGRPWIQSGDADVVGEFGCLGAIDSSDMNCSGSNDDEQPASAAAASLEEPWRSGANAGFVRDDALLVVLALTDEDEQPVPSLDAQGVYDRLVATKGQVERLVFLGVAGATDCQGVYGSADAAVKMKALTADFEASGRGLFWDLCGGRLEDGLTQAIALIDSACGDFPGLD